MIRKLVVLVLVPFLVLVTPVHAQTTRLEGVVTLRDGKPAPGVTMTIGSYSVVTDQSGHYGFDYLRPGQYVVTVSPRDKRPRSFPVTVNIIRKPYDFRIDW
jgi:hypothetical protein